MNAAVSSNNSVTLPSALYEWATKQGHGQDVEATISLDTGPTSTFSNGNYQLNETEKNDVLNTAKIVMDAVKSEGYDINNDIEGLEEIKALDGNKNELSQEELASYLAGKAFSLYGQSEINEDGNIFSSLPKKDKTFGLEMTPLATEFTKQVFGDTFPNLSKEDTSTQESLTELTDTFKNDPPIEPNRSRCESKRC